MRKLNILLGALVLAILTMSSTCNRDVVVKDGTDTDLVGIGTTDSKYKYETTPNDPLGVKIYTLENGMKVYMSVNKDAPRIQTMIAVRAGSKNDPSDATGLAHYLEHMLFKGSSNIGTLDWEKESVLLQQISDLYEEHRNETDPAKRKAIYAKIDKISNEAAGYVVANEYDKMVASLGAKGTNAFTSLEQTVYINDIPSNALDKWLTLESERFDELVLRLFHTELEAVYEEFNIGQDNDGRKVSQALLSGLFPTHTYGTQTTIGEGEHLKNPSMVKIHEYFENYYVPNNMAIVLSGDFDPDEAVALIEKRFGSYESKPVQKYNGPAQPAITSPIVKEVFGQQQEMIDIGFRFGGAGTNDEIMIELIDRILSNGQAGVVDLNLLQKQKVLDATAWHYPLAEYTAFGIEGTPRDGQSLDEVRGLLLDQLEAIKKGEFEDWLITAAIKDIKLDDIRTAESNQGRAFAMLGSFIKDHSWDKMQMKYNRMEKITKQEIIDFAKANLNDNYVVVYKRKGDDPNVYKVEKPTITPVPVNRDDQSPFLADFNKVQMKALSPDFIDYGTAIKQNKLPNGLQFDYIKNTSNETFQLYYIFDMGKNHDKRLPIAIDYLPYLGTDKYTAEELQKEFFKLGVSFSVNSEDEQVYISLSGLDESFDEGLELFEHILSNAKSDQAALDGVISDIRKQREEAKSNKRTILRGGMANYAKYGSNSAFRDVLSARELGAIKPAEMVTKIKELTSYQHRIFYYGSKRPETVMMSLGKHHKVPTLLKEIPQATEYTEQATTKDEVYFVDFPMVQAEILMISKGSDFDLKQHCMRQLYNDYFGAGLSSIVFQEIRESKALAYSAWAFYTDPRYSDRSHWMQAYVGTQVDKMPDAVTAMREILNNMPVSDDQIDQARQALMKKIESERITKSGIYWSAQSTDRLGYDYDLRKEVYKTMQSATKQDLLDFQATHVKGRNYRFMVLGAKDKVDMNYLKSLGPVKELSMEDLFGY